MTTQHPEALRLAAELDDGYPLTGDAISAAAELRRQHARIAELDAQLSSSGFAAADMASASAQGFRDGVASLAASAAPLRCGHPASLMLMSAETGYPLYCELCDSIDRRRDAETVETELRQQLVDMKSMNAQLTDALKTVRSQESDLWAPWLIKQVDAALASHGQAPAPTHEQIAAYLESTGAYVTNDATREAAIAEAIDTDRAKRGQAPDLHPKTSDLVQRFAAALAEKLSAAEKKYGYSDGWASPNWMDECRQHLSAHIAKGDPRDVAAYCAFLWHHGATTASPQAEQQAPTGSEIYVCARKCYNCGHAGINDDHADNAACKSCDWSGPSPEKDHCPDCEKDGTMTAACPMCSCAYIMVADTQVAAPAALNAPQAAATGTAPGAGITAGATEEVKNLRKALVYVAFALHDAPQYMLAQGITLINGDTVRVSRDGWTVEASVNPHRQPAPAETGNSVSAQTDSVQEDAARYRWLAASCRSTSEHWGGRWSIVVEGPAPKSHDSEDDFDAAVDAARKQGGE